MNNKFSKSYMELLAKQVNDEIQFLVKNGHNNQKIFIPCMFCEEHAQGFYTCDRLKELRRFQSTLIINQSDKLTGKLPVNHLPRTICC